MDTAEGKSETCQRAANENLQAACKACAPVLQRVFSLAHKQIAAEIGPLIAPYFSPERARAVADDTELQSKIGILSMRLRFSQPRTFADTLAWAALILAVLEDIAADREVFTLSEEAAAA